MLRVFTTQRFSICPGKYRFLLLQHNDFALKTNIGESELITEKDFVTRYNHDYVQLTTRAKEQEVGCTPPHSIEEPTHHPTTIPTTSLHQRKTTAQGQIFFHTHPSPSLEHPRNTLC